LPPLFPFSRTIAYVILAGSVPPPSSVWLRGTTPFGDELELEIPVQVLPHSGETIHQLAARKMLQELEEGTGYIHSGNHGVNKETNPGTFDDWVDREGIRLGVEYGLASEWTSFVAVQKHNKKAKETDEMEVDADADADADYWTDIESVTEVGDAGDYGYLAKEKSKVKTVVYQTAGGFASPFASPASHVSSGMPLGSAGPSRKRKTRTARLRMSMGGDGGQSGESLYTPTSPAYSPSSTPPAAQYAPTPGLQNAQQLILCSNVSARVSYCY
jgi:hypothetical protein